MISLKEQFEYYVNNVSNREMTISLKTAETIMRFLQERRPTRIADVGSGFSSFVAAKFAFETNAKVDIFDESPIWLYKTEKFIKGQGYHTSNIQYKPFSEFNAKDYDFIFFDTCGDNRLKHLEKLKGCTAFIILDDCHRKEYEKKMNKLGFKILKLTDETDEFGRFCGIVTK